MNLIPGVNITSSALDAEKLRMEAIAQNIANANTTRDENGEAYRRKIVSFESFIDPSMEALPGQDHARSVRVSSIDEDETPGPQIYNPHHPHADEQGMVTLPNVQPAREMVDLISVSRAYQANLSVIRTSKQMTQQVLSIGR